MSNDWKPGVANVVLPALLGLILALALLSPIAEAGANSGQLTLSTISSRPDMVSDGDTLVQLRIPVGTDLSDVTLEVNGEDKTADLQPGSDPALSTVLLSGLPLGASRVTASLDGYQTADLLVVNHPIVGPILSGPHQTPFYCETADSGLGAPLDADCSANTQLIYRYRTTGGAFAPLADPTAPYPADGAMTTTSTGETVPYAIVTEKGTINRAIYAITTLIDVGPGSTQDHAGAGWNRKLLYQFGGGCASGYHQSVAGNNVNGSVALGYATAQSTLNAFGVDCSDSISAETLSMVKEHFIETYGRPDGTIGFGTSGGSMAQQMINNNFPGLLDASALGRSFTDNGYAGNVLLDCAVVDDYVDSAAGWTTEQKHAVKGWALEQTCNKIVQTWHRVVFEPSTCDPHIPGGDIYNPVSNLTGIRCDLWTGNINVYGIDPETGFARQTTDNTGVQYGLEAVRDGTITFQQFLDLNANVGGINYDGQPVPERIAASNEALRIAYQRGQLNEGGAGYASVPTIDNRDYTTEVSLNGHSINHALAMRARLDNSNGNHDSQVIYTSPSGLSNEKIFADLGSWIDAINADHSDLSREQKVAQDRPAGISDSCYAGDGSLIAAEPASWDSGDCGAVYPSFELTRQAAGGPAASDVLKCQLGPIDPDGYGAAGPLDGTQVAALAGVFPDGVCDYSKPGIEQSVTRATWQPLPLSTSPDTDAPDTSISSLPSMNGPVRDVEFGFSSDEVGSTFECRLDSGAWDACVSPRSFSGLGGGDHVFEVRATDPAGNTDQSPASSAFTVDVPDTTAPETSIDSGPSGVISVDRVSFGFSSDEVGSTFECRLDSGAWDACVSPRSFSGLGGGDHVFEVRATDPAGNTDQSPASRAFTVKLPDVHRSLPKTLRGKKVRTKYVVRRGKAKVTLRFRSDQHGARFQCRKQTGRKKTKWHSCHSPYRLKLWSGTHLVKVRAVTAVGHDKTPLVFKVKIKHKRR